MQLVIGSACIVIGGGEQVLVTPAFVILHDGEDGVGNGLQLVGLVSCLDGEQSVIHPNGLSLTLHLWAQLSQ